jgi:choline dehydrogenase
MAIPIAWEVPAKESLTYVVTSPLKIGKEFFRYLLFGAGLLGMPVQGLILLVRGTSLDDATSELVAQAPPNSNEISDGILRADSLIPDIEMIPLNINAIDDTSPISKTGVFTILAALLRPKSRGSVRLRSSNPGDKPKVDLGFLSSAEDYVMARKSVRLALRIGEGMKAKGFPLLKGLSAPVLEASDEEIDTVIRHYARTTYHYSSTCRMASESDEKAPGVVDDSLRVYGVQNLRVCDASIFPQVIAAHLMAPVVMVAEKCADMIKASSENSI